MKQFAAKKAAFFLVILLLSMTFLTAFTYNGLGEVWYQEETYIGPGVYYENQTATHSSGSRQRSWTIDAETVNGNAMPFVYSGNITSKYTLSTMINNITSQGYTVIAGVNGDFYDTSTGIPLGMTVHEGYIKTSGLNEGYSLAFRKDGTAVIATVSISYKLSINGSDAGYIGYFNESQGAAKAMHLFNDQYASTTKTKGTTIEVVVNTSGGNEPSVGGKISGTVSAVIPNGNSAPIGPNQVVLSSVTDGAYAGTLSAMQVGDNITIEVTDHTSSGIWTNVTEAIGAHDLIAVDGNVNVTSNSASPRTAVGVKADGNIVIYAVDGRQSSHSAGLGMADVAKYLIARGCVHAVNFDGGGSTMIAAKLPGDSIAKRLNSPSDGSERAVSNGFFLVARTRGSGAAENLHAFPLTLYMMPGAKADFTAVATDNMYNTVSSVPSDRYFDVDDSLGTITRNGQLTAGSNSVSGKVYAKASGTNAEPAIVHVVKDFEFTPNVTSVSVKSGGTQQLSITKAVWAYANVVINQDGFNWTCDSHIGTIDSNNLFTAVTGNGISGNIYVEYNGTKKSIPVTVGESSDFKDISGHWAETYIKSLAQRGIVNGMGNNTFKPEDSVTRAQFVKMLAEGIGANVSGASAAAFNDVPQSEWYASYVNWAAGNGIVQGISETSFAPNAKITREQMAIMLVNFANHTETSLAATASVSFTDAGKINDWSASQVSTIVQAGIMNGRPDGSFDPQGNATRAESTKVLYMMFDLVQK